MTDYKLKKLLGFLFKHKHEGRKSMNIDKSVYDLLYAYMAIG